MWRLVVWLKFAQFSEECVAYIFWVKEEVKQNNQQLLCLLLDSCRLPHTLLYPKEGVYFYQTTWCHTSDDSILQDENSFK
jgi:hypothetical protein